jgi:hypothetical protein
MLCTAIFVRNRLTDVLFAVPSMSPNRIGQRTAFALLADRRA